VEDLAAAAGMVVAVQVEQQDKEMPVVMALRTTKAAVGVVEQVPLEHQRLDLLVEMVGMD
jgi:anti-sigma-K factor RskA